MFVRDENETRNMEEHSGLGHTIVEWTCEMSRGKKQVVEKEEEEEAKQKWIKITMMMMMMMTLMNMMMKMMKMMMMMMLNKRLFREDETGHYKHQRKPRKNRDIPPSGSTTAAHAFRIEVGRRSCDSDHRDMIAREHMHVVSIFVSTHVKRVERVNGEDEKKTMLMEGLHKHTMLVVSVHTKLDCDDSMSIFWIRESNKQK
jgi:hypothetical protein